MDPGSAAIRLVVNADGFGASPAITRGVLQGHRQGIITSTSIIGNCADPAAVKALLDEAPGLGVGVHLTLVKGPSVAPPNAVRSLLGPDGRFPSQPAEVLYSWAKGAMRADDVEREFEAQVARLADTGLRIDHLDTGFHLGFLPAIGRASWTITSHRMRGYNLGVPGGGSTSK